MGINKKVYILGSGASKSHSLEVFPAADEFIIKGYQLGLLSKKKKYNDLTQFLDETLNIKITSEKKINIEEILTFIEIEIERNSTPELLKYREQFLSLITEILQLLAKELTDGDYNHFKKHLDNSSTVLTFNWDLLLDNVLDRNFIIQHRCISPAMDPKEVRAHYLNFLIEISAHGEMTNRKATPSSPYKFWDGRTGYYLKLHGSIDWRYCINEGCRAFRKVYPIIDSLEKYFCSECHEAMQTLIIPPVLNKNYMSYPIIRKIWNVAVQEIKLTNEIIIWGYSLPPTDFYSQWLLRKTSPKNLKKVIIINPRCWKKIGVVPNMVFRRKFLNLFKNYEGLEFDFYRSFHEYLMEENKQFILTVERIYDA